MKSFLTKLIFQSLILVTKKDLDMENNKSPRNDGLTKEFYVFFWDEIK